MQPTAWYKSTDDDCLKQSTRLVSQFCRLSNFAYLTKIKLKKWEVCLSHCLAMPLELSSSRLCHWHLLPKRESALLGCVDIRCESKALDHHDMPVNIWNHLLTSSYPYWPALENAAKTVIRMYKDWLHRPDFCDRQHSKLFLSQRWERFWQSSCKPPV